MPSIILPDRRMLVRPHIITAPGCPEVYCDGATIAEYSEIVRITLYTRPPGELDSVEQNFTIIMRKSGFDASLIAAAADFLPGLAMQ